MPEQNGEDFPEVREPGRIMLPTLMQNVKEPGPSETSLIVRGICILVAAFIIAIFILIMSAPKY